MTNARPLALCGALATWAGLVLQLHVLVTGPLGIPGGAWRFVAFFTVLMNLFAAVLFTRAAILPTFSCAAARLQTASTVCMTMVGGVYVLVLQRLWDPKGLQFIADVLLHYAAPLVSILFWLLCVPKTGLGWRDGLRWAGIPIIYFVYVLGRAQLDGFYPYFFIDVTRLGWGQVLMNASGVLVAFVALCTAFVAAGKLLRRQDGTRHSSNATAR